VGRVVEQPEAVAEALQRKGKFILATNDTDAERLPAETMLSAYKGQGVSVERGFRFLKDPLFFADSLFLKRPERLMALLMVMGVALLVYALAEHTVRTELVRRGESLPNQLGQPTQQPTLRRIFQLFEGIDVLSLPQPSGVQRLVLNLKPIHRQILNLLGLEVQKCYFLDG
jgi:transposase